MANLQNRSNYDRETRDSDGDGHTSSHSSERRYQSEPRVYRNSGSAVRWFFLGAICATVFGSSFGLPYLFNNRQNTASADRNNPIVANPRSTNTSTSSVPPAATPAETATPLPAPQSLNLEVNDANGSVAQLTGISFAEDSTTIDLSMTNASSSNIKLNPNNQAMVLKDNLGNQYDIVPPADNPEVNIQPGTTLKGQFVFLGRVAPSASTLTLITNSEYSDSQETSRNPQMTFTIPVAARQ